MVDDGTSFQRFSDSISAGFPSPAEGYEDDQLNLHDYIVRNPAATFFYRVKGREMESEHIREGSILVVDRSIRPTLNKLVVIESQGEFVIARFARCGQHSIVCGVVVAAVSRF